MGMCKSSLGTADSSFVSFPIEFTALFCRSLLKGVLVSKFFAG